MAKFPRSTNPSPGLQGQPQLSETRLRQQQQQAVGQNSNTDNMHLASINGMPANNALNSGTVTSSANTIVGLLHQNSMNSRQQNPMLGTNVPYSGNSIQMPSPGSSSAMPQPQPSASPFQSPTSSSSNNPQQMAHSGLSGGAQMNSNSPNISMQQPGLSGDLDANDSQSSVQKILHEMRMTSSQIGGGGMMGVGTMGNDARNVNGILSSNNNGGLLRNGVANGNLGFGGAGFGVSGNGLSHSTIGNGTRPPPGNNSMSMNGGAGMTVARDPSMNQPQQDLSNQLLGLGAFNGFNDLQFDWKPSP